MGDVDNEPRLVIGGEYGKAEFRWTEKVVAIPYLPVIMRMKRDVYGSFVMSLTN